MKKKIKYIYSVFFICVLLSFIVPLVDLFVLKISLSLIQKMIIVLIQMLSIIGFAYFYFNHQNQEKKRKGKKIVCWILFLIYCFDLIYVLFLDPDFGRQTLTKNLSFEEYWQYSVNLDLFETIQLFIHGYQNNIVSLETLLRNLLGNFVVFMPMAYFLPTLFIKLNRFQWFLCVMFMMISIVEILQVVLRIGSGDIDDLFLNLLGCLLLYWVLKVISFYKEKKVAERK